MKWFAWILLTTLFVDPHWNADPSGAMISFSVKGPFGTVHGTFSGLKANIQFDEKGSGSISASVDASTVSTGIGMRNHDLRNEEGWFNTAKYPRISFQSGKITKTGGGYVAEGSLTMKGVTRPLAIPFTFTRTGHSGVFKGHFVLKREEFNLGKPGGSVGSEVTVELEVPVNQ